LSEIANPRGGGEGGWGGNKLMVYFEMHKKKPGKKPQMEK
jgi:hypothetical protein